MATDKPESLAGFRSTLTSAQRSDEMDTKEVCGVDLRATMLESIRQYAEMYVVSISQASKEDVAKMCDLALNRFVGKMNGRADGQEFVESLVAKAFEKHFLSLMESTLANEVQGTLRAWLSNHISKDKMPKAIADALSEAVSSADAAHAARAVEGDELRCWRLFQRGASTEDIADAVGIEESAVGRLLTRARNRVVALKSQLKAYEDIKPKRVQS